MGLPLTVLLCPRSSHTTATQATSPPHTSGTATQEKGTGVNIPFDEVVLQCDRLAIRPSENAPRQWYGEPVRYMLKDGKSNWHDAMLAIAHTYERAVAEYGLDYCKRHAVLVSGPPEQALTLVDLNEEEPSETSHDESGL